MNTNTSQSTELITWEQDGIVREQNKLANFIAQLQNLCDINQEGLPLQYIDPTVIAECLPYCETTDDVPDEKYKQAITKLDIEDGILCIQGLPFWERLDGETFGYYKIFKEYRDMKYVNDTHLNTRSIARLSELINVPGRLLNILSKIYHWAPRIKTYDMFKQRDISLRRARQAEELEGKHAKYSNDLLEQAIKYLKEHPGQLNPKTALQMVELGMKYGRISAGLLGDKPGAQGQGSAVHQTNITLAQSTTHNQADQMVNINAGDTQGQGTSGGNKSRVEQQLADNMKDNTTLASVLHVLNKSGAFAAMKPREEKAQMTDSDGYDIDDAEVIEVEVQGGDSDD
jgi:hypothetical protein